MAVGKDANKVDAIKNAIANQFPTETYSIGDFHDQGADLYGVTVQFPQKNQEKLVSVEVMRSNSGWKAEVLNEDL